MAIILLSLFALWILLQIPFFQQFLADRAARELSKRLNTEVKVGYAYFGFANRLTLKDVLIKDWHKDTLAYIGKLQLNTNDWFFARDTIVLHYVGLDNAYFHLERRDSIWNYRFLSDFFAGGSSGNKATKPIKLNLNNGDFNNIRFQQRDLWRGRTLIAGVGKLHFKASKTDINSNHFQFDYLHLQDPQYREIKKNGLWSENDSLRHYARVDSLDALRTGPDRLNPGDINLFIAEVKIGGGNLQFYNRRRRESIAGQFDDRDIIISGLEGHLRDVRLNADTLTATANLKADERSGARIKSLITKFKLHPQLMEFADMDLQTNESRLGPYFAMRYRSIEDMEYFIEKVKMEAHFEKSSVSMQDVAFFAPELKHIRQVGLLSGDASGTVSDFIIHNLNLETGRSRITGTYAMRGLTNIDQTNIRFTTTQSRFDLPDIAVWAPELKDLYETPVKNLGMVNFAGSFTGTPYDFFADGKFSTNAGTIDADLTLKLYQPGMGYTSQIKSADIDGAKLLGVPALGRLLFRGTVGSNGFSATNPVAIKGTLDEITYADYTYKQIAMDGVYDNNKLHAAFDIDDVNLSGSITTILDFDEKEQSYNGKGILQHANLNALGISRDTLLFAGSFDVDFRGKTIDDFLGYARFFNTRVSNSNLPLVFDSLLVVSTIDTTGVKTWLLQTNEIKGQVKGIFNISSLSNSFTYFLHRYYPTIIAAPAEEVPPQAFSFQIQTGEAEPFIRLFDKNIGGLNFINLLGYINTTVDSMVVFADIPQFSYGTMDILNIAIQGYGNETDLQMTGSFDNLQMNQRIGFPNGNITLNTIRDTTQLTIATTTQGAVGNASINAEIYSQSDGFEMQFNESSFILNNKKWLIEKDGMFQLKNGFIVSNGLTLSQDRQKIKVVTRPSEEGSWNDVLVNLENLSMGDLIPFVLTEPRLEGEVTGNIVIEDPLGAMKFDAGLAINQFWFNNDSIGAVRLSGNYSSTTELVNAQFASKNPGYEWDGKVLLDLNKNADRQIESSIVLQNERLTILKKYLGAVFEDMDGYATGNLRVSGSFEAPAITGTVKISEASLLVDYTKVNYFVDSATILFGNNYIDFGVLNIKDNKGRTGKVQGRFYHRFFDSLYFDLSLRTDGMEVLNTGAADNDLFYGNAVAKATFDLNGPLNNLNMRMTGVPTDSSYIAIANKEGKASGEADYIVFKEYGSEMQMLVDTSETNFHINLELTANPLCRIDVILDDLTGDVITATGSGNLTIKSGSAEPTVMRGRYVIEKGSYNYTFQSLIRKPFELSGDGSNFIEWSGDPYDANMNITATYLARDVSLRDLISDERANMVLDQDARNYKGNVYVIANLRGKLSKPDIDFDIEFPQGSVMRNNISALDMLRRIREDESEKLRQVTYLIVFRSFAPYRQGGNARNPGADLAVNTISELVSREMGKILTGIIQDITRDRSLSVDLSTNFYNSSQTLANVNAFNQYDRVNVNFNLNKSYFNNRVVFNIGSDFDMSVRNTAVAGFQFLPDVSVEFILTNNRRLRAILFKRDNLDIIGRRNRAGASISYRKDFDKLFGGNKAEEPLIFVSEGELEN